MPPVGLLQSGHVWTHLDIRLHVPVSSAWRRSAPWRENEQLCITLYHHTEEIWHPWTSLKRNHLQGDGVFDHKLWLERSARVRLLPKVSRARPGGGKPLSGGTKIASQTCCISVWAMEIHCRSRSHLDRVAAASPLRTKFDTVILVVKRKAE